MADSMFDLIAEQARKTFEQATRMQQQAMSGFEKIADIQMERFREYAELATRQARELGEVRDVEGLKSFLSSQAEFATTVSKKMMEDLREMGEIANRLRTDLTESAESEKAPASQDKAGE